MARLKPVFVKMFASVPIKPYHTIKTADPLFANDRHWREAQPDERRLILDEYTGELRHREEAADREKRQRNIQLLGELIRSLDITVSTRWRAAHDMIVSAPTFKEDPGLQQIETIDILGVYDDYARQLEREHDDESRRLRIETARKARKAREGFKALLAEMVASGELTRSSKWKDFVKRLKEEPAYQSLLGMPGSSPLDLWMDAVDDLAEETERAAEKIQKGLSGKEMTAETTLEEYEQWIKDAHMDTQIDSKLRKDVYDLVSASAGFADVRSTSVSCRQPRTRRGAPSENAVTVSTICVMRCARCPRLISR
jgi:pre-mRNA-processing factor 40